MSKTIKELCDENVEITTHVLNRYLVSLSKLDKLLVRAYFDIENTKENCTQKEGNIKPEKDSSIEYIEVDKAIIHALTI